MIIERIVSNDALENFYNKDLTITELLSTSWNTNIFKVGDGFKIIKIEIPEKEDEK